MNEPYKNKQYLKVLLKACKIPFAFDENKPEEIIVGGYYKDGKWLYQFIAKKYYKFMSGNLGITINDGTGAYLQIIKDNPLLQKLVFKKDYEGLIMFKLLKGKVIEVIFKDNLIEEALKTEPQKFAISVLCSIPPYPYETKNSQIFIVNAKGDTLKICQRELYRELAKSDIPDLQYRNDIGLV